MKHRIQSLLVMLVSRWARRNGLMLVPESKIHPEAIRAVRKALKDEAAGNSRCTMTDLDLACVVLDEVLKFTPPDKAPDR